MKPVQVVLEKSEICLTLKEAWFSSQWHGAPPLRRGDPSARRICVEIKIGKGLSRRPHEGLLITRMKTVNRFLMRRPKKASRAACRVGN
jgi:hypothetical protein